MKWCFYIVVVLLFTVSVWMFFFIKKQSITINKIGVKSEILQQGNLQLQEMMNLRTEFENSIFPQKNVLLTNNMVDYYTIDHFINKPYLYKNLIADNKKPLIGGLFIGSNDPGSAESQYESLFTMTGSMDMWTNDIKVSCKEPYRYIRFLPPSDTISLCEVVFKERQNGRLIEIPNVKVSANVKGFKDDETLDMLTDHLSATGFKGVFRKREERQQGILFDLGKPCKLEQISYIPYKKSEVADSLDFELYYWDNEWKSAGAIKGNNNFITFKQIPQNTIYKVIAPKIQERIFTYSNGIINWF